MSIFNQTDDKVTKDKTSQEPKKEIDTSSALGRSITSVESARKELFFKPNRQNPLNYINSKAGHDFFGFEHKKDEVIPIFLETSEKTMLACCGATGTYKGVFLANRAVQQIQRRAGLIEIDPKQDDFLPQVILEELERQGRPEDLLICSWPLDFGYDGINKDDTAMQVANKLIDTLGLEPSTNPGVDHYRKRERQMLVRILNMFWNGDLGFVVEKNLKAIVKSIIALKEDLRKKEMYDIEIVKARPNANILNKCVTGHFDANVLETIGWNKGDADTIESLAISLLELTQGANIKNTFSVDDVLKDNKVLYLKIDMLDVASLKFAKMLITDITQRARAVLPKERILIQADEISFYANARLSAALATTRGFNVDFDLAFQDIAQIPDNLRAPILSNCNVRLFYKPFDPATLQMLELVGGKELVTNFSRNGNSDTISQSTEPLLNVTRVRALPRAGVYLLVADALNTPKIVQSNFIETRGKFDWHKYNKAEKIDPFAEIDSAKQTVVARNTAYYADILQKYRKEFKIADDGVISVSSISIL